MAAKKVIVKTSFELKSLYVCEKCRKQDCHRGESANIGQSLDSSLKTNAKLQTVPCTLGETLNDQIKAFFKAAL